MDHDPNVLPGAGRRPATPDPVIEIDVAGNELDELAKCNRRAASRSAGADDADRAEGQLEGDAVVGPGEGEDQRRDGDYHHICAGGEASPGPAKASSEDRLRDSKYFDPVSS